MYLIYIFFEKIKGMSPERANNLSYFRVSIQTLRRFALKDCTDSDDARHRDLRLYVILSLYVIGHWHHVA